MYDKFNKPYQHFDNGRQRRGQAVDVVEQFLLQPAVG